MIDNVSPNHHYWFTIGGERYVVDFPEVELNLNLFDFPQEPLMRSKIKVVINKQSSVNNSYRTFEDMKTCESITEVNTYIRGWLKETANRQRQS